MAAHVILYFRVNRYSSVKSNLDSWRKEITLCSYWTYWVWKRGEGHNNKTIERIIQTIQPFIRIFGLSIEFQYRLGFILLFVILIWFTTISQLLALNVLYRSDGHRNAIVTVSNSDGKLKNNSRNRKNRKGTCPTSKGPKQPLIVPRPGDIR